MKLPLTTGMVLALLGLVSATAAVLDLATGESLEGRIQLREGNLVETTPAQGPLRNLSFVLINGIQFGDTESGEGGPTGMRQRGSGLLGHYHDNMDFTGKTVTQIDETIDANWGGESPIPGIGREYFSVRWTGYLQPPVTGEYTFYFGSDDGGRLWVNQELYLERWQRQEMTNIVGAIRLEGGRRYPIKIEYCDVFGNAKARFFWSGPGIPKAIVPRRVLYPAALHESQEVIALGIPHPKDRQPRGRRASNGDDDDDEDEGGHQPKAAPGVGPGGVEDPDLAAIPEKYRIPGRLGRQGAGLGQVGAILAQQAGKPGLLVTLFSKTNFTGKSRTLVLPDLAALNEQSAWKSATLSGQFTAPETGRYWMDEIPGALCRIWVNDKHVYSRQPGDDESEIDPIDLEKNLRYLLRLEWISEQGKLSEVTWRVDKGKFVPLPARTFSATTPSIGYYRNVIEEEGDFEGRPPFRAGQEALPGITTVCGSFLAANVAGLNENEAVIQMAGQDSWTLPRSAIHHVLFRPVPTNRLELLSGTQSGLLFENGDFLEGDIVGLTGGELTLKSLLFGNRTYSLQDKAVGARLQAQEATPRKTEWEVRLKNQSRLRGNLVQTDRDHIYLLLPSMNQPVAVKASRIQSMVRVKGRPEKF